ncbi:MAG TPA: GtrA family protein [Actinomycetota bacterium]|nr:GtrA family protein [Actinomycetota bacterium]
MRPSGAGAARALWQHHAPTLRRLLVFGTVSVVATLVDLAVFNLLLRAEPVPRFVATSTGYGVGLVVNYLLNRWVTFRGGGRDRWSEEFALFALISVAGLLLNNAAVETAARLVGTGAGLLTGARLVVATVLWTAKFVLVQRWVFPPRAGAASAEAPLPAEAGPDAEQAPQGPGHPAEDGRSRPA